MTRKLLGSLGSFGSVHRSAYQHMAMIRYDVWLSNSNAIRFITHTISLQLTNLNLPLKIGPNPKGKSSPNHHFSGAMLVSRRISLTISR